jgi:hypothetical protein
MSVTIELDGPLASQLQAQAADRQLPPDEFARRLLGEALQHIDQSERWQAQNCRRIDLIKKSSAQALTAHEAAELQSLQDLADRRLEERDRQLLEQLDHFQQAARTLADDATAG